jgi:hypothetical protein
MTTQEQRMTMRKRVLIVGLQPQLIDFSNPEYTAFPGLNADRVMEGLDAGVKSLASLGYEANLCLTDLGDTAEDVLKQELTSVSYDCVMIGAGVRIIPMYFLLFENMINIIHQHAPGARICFNTKPSDTAEAVKRWL